MFKNSSNLIVQIVSAVLWIFAIAGLQINPETTGTDLVNHISTSNWPLLLVLIINVGNSAFSWIMTWKTNKPNFSLFLKSTNWWVSFCNILFSVLAMRGITVPIDASHQIVDFIMDKQWWALVGYLLPNVIGPAIRAFTKKQTGG